MTDPGLVRAAAALAVLGLVALAGIAVPGHPAPRSLALRTLAVPRSAPLALANDSVVGNFSASLGRIVALLGAAGGAILAIAWARVALSWFSTDVTKKVQAKDRARDAIVGTVIFAAALSGLVWSLAQWILTGG
ncbi:MAG TPA: hypothetical protein VGV64_05505 [Thermoplasmata archaeon]|nr:hypothetical protein [Thermoplasmata archaeon]